MGFQTKTMLPILLLLLLLFIDLYTGFADDMNPEDLLSEENIFSLKIRKLGEIGAMLDYTKDPEPNPKHEPPKKPGGGNR